MVKNVAENAEETVRPLDEGGPTFDGAVVQKLYLVELSLYKRKLVVN
jgi:hypothetical protein